MKILYVITRAERGGGQVHVLDLIRGLRHHCELEVAAGEDGFLLDEARQLGARCHLVPNLVHPLQPAKDFQAFREIVTLIRTIQPHLVHAHTSKAGILGRLAARFCGVPSVFTAHTWCFAEGTSWKWKLLGMPCERIAALTGGTIINVSDANRRLALKHRVAKPSRLVTIHNGIPDEPAHSCARPGDPAVIMVARFAPQKNQAMLLEAAAQLAMPFTLQFAGSGPTLPDVQRRANQLGIESRIQFLGDRSDVRRLLSRASIFALTTNWEGFPLSILEAMRAGLPIIACDVGGVREAVIDGANGFLIQPGDTKALVTALATLLTDECLRHRMGAESRWIFEERFTAQHMFRMTYDVYRRSVSMPVGAYVPSGSEASENV
jgi:glycosyltransferase involved in cell wall biosynthesis